MKNETTFVRMGSSGHPGDAKRPKKAPRFVEFNILTNRKRQKFPRPIFPLKTTRNQV